MGNSSSGHVCNSPQHASSPVYVSSSRASSIGDRYSITRLAGEDDVHVSTVSPAQQSQSEAQDHSGGRGDTHSPLVAISTMVSTPTTSVCGLQFFPYETYCHNRDMFRAASHTICTHGGSQGALPSSRIFKRGL